MQASVVPMEDDTTAPANSEPAQDASEAMEADDVKGGPAQPEQHNWVPSMATGTLTPGPDQLPVAAVTASPVVALFSEQATYTPMRLDMKERRYFQLLEAALGVSEYTDRVDILTWKRKDGRVLQQVKDICSILSGLVVAQVNLLSLTSPPRLCCSASSIHVNHAA